MTIDDYLLDTSNIDNISAGLNVPELNGQSDLIQRKQINLNDRMQAKQKKFATAKDKFQSNESLAYGYQGTTNFLKDVANTVLPSQYEFNKYELETEGADAGNLYLLGDQDQRITRLQEDTATGALSSISGNDGDTVTGNRLVGIDTPESMWMEDGGTKFQRIKKDFGISDQDQITAGKNATAFGKEWLKNNPDTVGTTTGKDFFDRNLVHSPEYNKAMVEAGYAVPSQDAPQELWQAYNKAKADKKGNFSDEAGLGYVMDAMQLDGSKYTDNLKAKEDTFEFVDAFQSAGIRLAGQAVKAIGELVESDTVDAEGKTVDGAIEALGKRMEAKSDEWAGYNPRAVRKAEIKLSSAKAKLGRGDILGGFSDFVGGAWEGGPQVLAQSAPELLAMAGTAAAVGNPVGGFLAGVTAVGSIKANDALDEREQNNEGKKASFEEVAAVTGAQMLKTAFDYGAFKFITLPTGKMGVLFKGTDTPTPLSEALKLTNKTRKKEFAKAFGTLATGGAVEVGQELTSDTIDTISRELGTSKFEGDSITDILKRMEQDDKFIQTAGLSFGSGTAFAAPSTVKELKTGLQDISKVESIRADVKGLVTEEDQTLEDLTLDEQEATFTKAKEISELALKWSKDRDTDLGNGRDTFNFISSIHSKVISADALDLATTMQEIAATEEGAAAIRGDISGVVNAVTTGTAKPEDVAILIEVATAIGKASKEVAKLEKLQGTVDKRIQDTMEVYVKETDKALNDIVLQREVISQSRPETISNDKAAKERAELREAQAEVRETEPGSVEESELSHEERLAATRLNNKVASTPVKAATNLVGTSSSKELKAIIEGIDKKLNTAEIQDTIKRLETGTIDGLLGESDVKISARGRAGVVKKLQAIVDNRERAEGNVRVAKEEDKTDAKKVARSIADGQKATVKLVKTLGDSKEFEGLLDGKTPVEWVEDIKKSTPSGDILFEALTRHPELIKDVPANRSNARLGALLEARDESGTKQLPDAVRKTLVDRLSDLTATRANTRVNGKLVDNYLAANNYARLKQAVITSHKAKEATADELLGMKQMVETAVNQGVLSKAQADRLAKLRDGIEVIEDEKVEQPATEGSEESTTEPTEPIEDEADLDEAYNEQRLKGVDVEAMTQLKLDTLAKELGIKVC